MDAAIESAGQTPRPMPGSLFQISRRPTRPRRPNNSREPSNRPAVVRVGILRGDDPRVRRGDHQHRPQHGTCVLQPACRGGSTSLNTPRRRAPRPLGRAGSTPRSSTQPASRSRATRCRRLPAHLAPQAPVGGISGESARSIPTRRGSNLTNDVPDSRRPALVPRRCIRSDLLPPIVLEIPQPAGDRGLGRPSAVKRRPAHSPPECRNLSVFDRRRQ
jgi:hypothetical protein